MKLLFFSDVHCDVDAARRLVEEARGVDAVVGAGDFGTVRRGVRTAIKILRAIDRPAILVAGNNESTEELVDACQDWPTAHVLHGSGITVGTVAFFGLGGGIPVTPFGSWSYDFSEEEAAALLEPASSGCVLVTHSPPRGAVDQDSAGRSLGSTAVRAAIERVRPAVVVCGHIHASAGRHETIGTTPVVNAGPGGVLWELPAVVR